jgi:hypothetical protein
VAIDGLQDRENLDKMMAGLQALSIGLSPAVVNNVQACNSVDATLSKGFCALRIGELPATNITTQA